MRAQGTFTVTLTPLAMSEKAEGSPLGRRSLDKRFQGDLDATSVGEMLSAGTAVQGSAAYVAIEHVTGTLGGRSGSFTLSHNATMNRGAPALAIAVVPDSGTGRLEGLAGTMNVVIDAGRHSYEFTYTLPDGG